MLLRTLGALSVEGVPFRREKVLLLLAYLCLEGPQPRRRLAGLFWPEAANPMNSLAQHLVHLRALGEAAGQETVREGDGRVEALTGCDACALREAARAGRAAEAAELYGGPFLGTLALDLPPDLEEWVFETREAVAAEARAALLDLAGTAAARGDAPGAAAHAARALDLPGAPPPGEAELTRLWHLLGAGHPLSARVEREARDLGLALDAPAPQPAVPFLGRGAELALLAHLAPGRVAWVSAPAGLGKSALLHALERGGGWTVLADAAAAPRALRDPRARLLLDAWDEQPGATRAAVEAALQARPGAALVIAARRHPPFEVDLHLPLGPLAPEDLADHPGLHARTEGHPTLVGAALRGQPLDVRQGGRVRALGASVRDTYLLLALQQTPDLAATRRAAGLDPEAYARALAALIQEGLIAEDGHVYAAAAAREHLGQVPVHAQLLNLKLARALGPPQAWPHFEAARALWDERDEERAGQAAEAHALAARRRGLPGEAARVLDLFAHRADLAMSHAWALLAVGRYGEALRRADEAPPGEDTRLARATALVRLGRVDEAVALAGHAPPTGPDAARAASILAQAARIRGQWEDARRHSQIAADLWQLEGEDEARVTELGLVALARSHLGTPAREAFGGVLAQAKHYPGGLGAMQLNLATRLVKLGSTREALELLEAAAANLRAAGDLSGQAQALVNRGALLHLAGELHDAADLYRRAIAHLRGTGSVRNLGYALSNLSEIEGDLSAFEDILELLERAGQSDLVIQIKRNASVMSRDNGPALRS